MSDFRHPLSQLRGTFDILLISEPVVVPLLPRETVNLNVFSEVFSVELQKMTQTCEGQTLSVGKGLALPR